MFSDVCRLNLLIDCKPVSTDPVFGIDFHKTKAVDVVEFRNILVNCFCTVSVFL